VQKTSQNYKKLVGRNVKRLRLVRQMTQEDLAEKCGIYRTYLSRIESGNANLTLVVLVALAHSLQVMPHELLVHP
jgi:transcriptional regulator with XRE-family HTH domain